jgi:DNA excision repair protein ERCC-4
MAPRSQPSIIADVREELSGVPAKLESLGAQVSLRRLVAGDYVVGDGAVVERKRVPDLHLSLAAGRLFRQLGDVRTSCQTPYLLVEGLRVDAGPLPANAIRGALLATVELGFTVLRSESTDDSALWLVRLAARRQRRNGSKNRRPLYAQRPSARPDHVPEAILAAIPTISTASARALLNEFGSVEAVLAASRAELMRVPGIGPERVRRLKEAVTRPRSAYRSRRSRD